MSPLLLTIVAGILLGGIWGLVDGLMQRNNIFPGRDLLPGIVRSVIGAAAGFLVTGFLFGSAVSGSLGVIMVGVIVSILVERRVRG